MKKQTTLKTEPNMKNEILVTDRKQLVHYLEQGCKPIERWSIGTEHEHFLFQLPELTRVPYDGPRSIEALLTAFSQNNWQPIYENNHLIALQQKDASITLEPGGQIELSGAKLKTLHEMLAELERYHGQLVHHLKSFNLAILPHAVDPKTPQGEMPWMPKQRYEIMRAYMPTRGIHGLDMMTGTATVQVNLDYSSQEDLGKKFKVSMALQPIATAMFANSPIYNGKLTGYKSFREHIWAHTDPDRCGLLPFVFKEDFNFEKYIDYILSVPMYFVKRGDTYFNHAGQSFKDFMNGKLEGREGEYPSVKDFEDHLSTAFPEVRLKQYLEMRGVDGGSMAHIRALSAFWTGLLYDNDTLNEAYDLTKDWTLEECQRLLQDVTRLGYDATFRGQSSYETAKTVLELAHQGLKRRQRFNASGQDEAIYLDYLFDLIDRRICPADILIHRFTNVCDQDIDRFLLASLETGE